MKNTTNIGTYYLKNKNKIVLEFELVQKKIIAGNTIGYEHDFINIIEYNHFKPHFLNIYGSNLINWLKIRKAPTQRENIEKIFNIEKNDMKSFIDISLCLSLNDTFWICPKNKELLWENVNLYNNPFNKRISLLAIGANLIDDENNFGNSPEYTTNGMLKKCWHRNKNNEIKLLKGSFEKIQVETGNEVFNEYYMAQIAEILNIDCVKYDLENFHNILVSSCKIFTDENIGFVPIRFILDKKINDSFFTKQQIAEIIKNTIDEDFFSDIMVFDGIIMNQDRHLNNFGMLFDNDTGKILKPAPIFDNGFAIFNFIKKHSELENTDEFKAIDSLEALLEIGFKRKSFFNISFNEQVLLFAKDRHIEGIEKLQNFSFKKHSKFNLKQEELNLIEKTINLRAKYFLNILKNKSKNENKKEIFKNIRQRHK